MKQFTLVLSLFFSSFLFAQDYLPVPLEQTGYYQTTFFSNGLEWNDCAENDCLIGIQVDSVFYNPDTTSYYFSKMLRLDFELCESSSWLGSQVIVLNNGNQIYANKDNQPILILPFAIIEETWSLFEFDDSTYIEATLSDRFDAEIIGMLDSIIQIDMTRKDNQGNVVDHPMNGKSILLSKTLGFLETFDFYNFPEDEFSKTLVGYKNPNPHGVVPPKTDRIFDFEIGNEYHYKAYSESDFFPWKWSESFKKIIILNKNISNNGDTIIYTIDWSYYNKQGSVSDPIQVLYSHDTFPMDIILSRFDYLNQLPYQPIYTGIYSGFVNSYLSDENVFVKTYDYYYYSENSECLFELAGSGIYNNRSYTTCIGLFSVEERGGGNFERLVYYNKTGEEWGTPIDFDDLTSVSEVALQPTLFKILPNPVDEYLWITSDQFQNEAIRIELFSLDGKLLCSKKELLNEKIKVEIPNTSATILFLKISTYQNTQVEKILRMKE